MSKKVLILHHTDLDGAMSGGVCGYYCQKLGYEPTYKLYNYGYPIKPENFKGFDLVFAVDISFHETDPWVYQYLGRQGKLIWIDHHKSAIEFKSKHPEYFEGVIGTQKIGKGACELTWEYLFPDSKTPRLIQYLSAYDVWDKERFDWAEVTEPIQYGCRLEYGISAKDLCNYLGLLELGLTDYLEELRQSGKNILKYIEKNLSGKIKNYGSFIPEFNVEGVGTYRILLLNTNEFSSKSFDGMYDPRFYDIMAPYCICPREGEPGKFDVRMSFYTDKPDIDVSKVAEIFGGGGHSGAAGCAIDLATLQTILECSMSLKEYDNWLWYTGKKK